VFKGVRLSVALWTLALVLSAFFFEVAAQCSCPNVVLTLVEASASSQTRPVRNGHQTILVRRDPITTTSDISEVKVAGDDYDTLIQIKYAPAAAARLLAATTDHDGIRLAFVVDDEVLLAFTWQGPDGIGPGGTQLSLLDFGVARANRLAESIRACIGNQPSAEPR
jgi:hypothetical protein